MSKVALLEKQIETEQANLKSIKEIAKTEFENLAQTILDSKSAKLVGDSKLALESVLKPLSENINRFEKSIDEKYSNEGKERHSLKSEIERLVKLNENMTKDTQSLTQALRGDSKTQGDWGELVLEKILEASGLKEGREYSRQQARESHNGESVRPDIIVNLPENKHMIVDSKVSLTAYELHKRTDDATEKEKALAAHLRSVQKHVDELSEKHYSRMRGVNSPEFVFLFVPIEPAYILAMEHDRDLAEKAFKKGVVIVTASTLLASLKTVSWIWRLENQNKNAQEIANEAAKLYDKFVGFYEDFEKLGKLFESGQSQYNVALGKLKTGQGNVFRKMEVLRDLGAAPTKKIKPDLVE